MSKMIQIRNVPESLHRELVKRAADEGLTLTDFITRILERELGRPTREELIRRIESHPPTKLDRPIAGIIREERRLAGRED